MAYNTQYKEIASEVIDFRADQSPSSLDSVLGDGVHYSNSVLWQSPEGNFYGQTRSVKDFYQPIMWTGEAYIDVKPLGSARSLEELPPGPNAPFAMFQIPRTDATDAEITRGYTAEVVFWHPDNQEWTRIEWLWDIDIPSEVPYPGIGIGKAHLFIRHHQQVMWNGFRWIPIPAHSNVYDDEPDRHLAQGFITNYQTYQTNTNGAIQFLQSQQAEARLEFLSKSILGLLSSVPGKTGALWVGDELLLTDDVSYVENTDSVLQYSNGTVTTDTIDPNTEYYVYCGNSSFTACSSGLFLSQTPDINGRLGDEEPGTNARIVGVVETDSAGYFVREIDMSYIGKKVEFSQTFWEYSDYQLQFVDEDNLAFNRIDGTHGLFYINGQLLYLGTGKDLSRADYRIEWSAGPVIDTSDIAAETTYQIYIANDSVEYNFNNNDDETGLPYEEGHQSYISALDFRRQLFLSTKAHDHRVFDGEYPGYYARHIGQVQTDETGYFRYAADISLIRQPTLNPTHLDGLAECVIQDVSTTQFKVVRKKGTTGIVYVGGKPVQTYDADNPLVHIITTSDALYEYDETEIDAPLTDSGLTVAEKPGVSIYLYMANDIDAWQGVSTFCSLEEPHSGYLSTNWPGNQARWLATIQLAPATLGSELVTNGSFATDTVWTKGTGWSWVEEDQNMLHATGETASLSQDVGAIAGELYACTFYISGRTAGIAAPKIGGTSGQSIAGNTSSTQYLLATNTDDLEVVPDTYFDGTVDNVSVKKVITGQFSGTYIKDSVGGVSAQIDDSVVSTSTTYSSNKIEQIKQQLLGKISLALGLNGSHTSGLDLQLEYVDSTTISLKALSADVDVVFPNLEVVTITTAGITKTVSGSTSTLYYVYLTTAGELDISTNEPTDIYSAISFYGETNVLVGWLGCSASNAIAGTHNVYSFWNEPQRAYTQNTTSFSSTLSLPGFVSQIESGVTWSGSIVGYTTAIMDSTESGGSDCTATATATSTSTSQVSGTGSCSPGWNPSITWYVTRYQTVSLSSTTVETGVSSPNITISGSQSYSTTINSRLQSQGFTSYSGTITLTRPGS